MVLIVISICISWYVERDNMLRDIRYIIGTKKLTLSPCSV
jgi:hypothetical protein